MTALGAHPQFACPSCGSPSISVPDEIHDAAEVHCAGCGMSLGSWHAFKERTRQVILKEVCSGVISADRASSDLPIQSLLQPWGNPQE